MGSGVQQLRHHNAAQTPLPGSDQDWFKSRNGVRAVAAGIVQDDDYARAQVLGDDPGNITAWRPVRIICIRGTQNGGVPALRGEVELGGTNPAATGAKEFSLAQAERRFGAEQACFKAALQGKECTAMRVGVVANFVSGGADGRHDFRVAAGALANQEKCCVGIMPGEQVQYLRRVDGIRPIIKGNREQRLLRFDAPDNPREKPFDHTHSEKRLHKED